jgi:hypothetical protein
MSERKYKAVPQLTRAKLEQLLSSSDPRNICDGLLSASYWEPDWQWAQEECLRHLDSPNVDVRSSAANGLGLLAIFHGKSDLDRVIPRLTALLNDPAVAPYADDAIEDVRHFVIKLKGRVKGERLPPPET